MSAGAESLTCVGNPAPPAPTMPHSLAMAAPSFMDPPGMSFKLARRAGDCKAFGRLRTPDAEGRKPRRAYFLGAGVGSGVKRAFWKYSCALGTFR